MSSKLNVSPNLFLITSQLTYISGKYGFPVNLSGEFNDTTNSLNHYWKQSAIAPNVIAAGVEDDMIIEDDYYNADRWTEIEDFQIINSLWYGKCTSITFKKPRLANDWLIIGTMFHEISQPKELQLILHDVPGARFSLVPGDYLSKGSKVEPLQLGELKILGVTRRRKNLSVQAKQGLCKEYDSQDSQAKCNIQEVLVKKYEQHWNETFDECLELSGNNATSLCYIPQAMNVFEMMDPDQGPVEQCTTQQEYACMMKTLATQPRDRNVRCPDPCMERSFMTMSKSIPHDMDDTALLFLHYQSDRIAVLEEYLIFDFSSILVAIGGSLGLFLGFSFFQCGSKSASWQSRRKV